MVEVLRFDWCVDTDELQAKISCCGVRMPQYFQQPRCVANQCAADARLMRQMQCHFTAYMRSVVVLVE